MGALASSPPLAEVFVTNAVPYNLRGSTNLVLPKARTNLYGIDTVRFVGQKLWQNVSKEIKESQSLDIFKRNIKAIPPKVHSMHLGQKISGVELAFPSAWRRGYCLNYNL